MQDDLNKPLQQQLIDLGVSVSLYQRPKFVSQNLCNNGIANELLGTYSILPIYESEDINYTKLSLPPFATFIADSKPLFAPATDKKSRAAQVQAELKYQEMVKEKYTAFRSNFPITEATYGKTLELKPVGEPQFTLNIAITNHPTLRQIKQDEYYMYKDIRMTVDKHRFSVPAALQSSRSKETDSIFPNTKTGNTEKLKNNLWPGESVNIAKNIEVNFKMDGTDYDETSLLLSIRVEFSLIRIKKNGSENGNEKEKTYIIESEDLKKEATVMQTFALVVPDPLMVSNQNLKRVFIPTKQVQFYNENIINNNISKRDSTNNKPKLTNENSLVSSTFKAKWQSSIPDWIFTESISCAVNSEDALDVIDPESQVCMPEEQTGIVTAQDINSLVTAMNTIDFKEETSRAIEKLQQIYKQTNYNDFTTSINASIEKATSSPLMSILRKYKRHAMCLSNFCYTEELANMQKSLISTKKSCDTKSPFVTLNTISSFIPSEILVNQINAAKTSYMRPRTMYGICYPYTLMTSSLDNKDKDDSNMDITAITKQNKENMSSQVKLTALIGLEDHEPVSERHFILDNSLGTVMKIKNNKQSSPIEAIESTPFCLVASLLLKTASTCKVEFLSKGDEKPLLSKVDKVEDENNKHNNKDFVVLNTQMRVTAVDSKSGCDDGLKSVLIEYKITLLPLGVGIFENLPFLFRLNFMQSVSCDISMDNMVKIIIHSS